MDPKCSLTSTDLQTRRARCQHQLSFLFRVSHTIAYCTNVLPEAVLGMPEWGGHGGAMLADGGAQPATH